MAKDGMRLVIRADSSVTFKSLREIWEAVNTPGVTVIADGHVNIEKSQRSKQPKQTSVQPRPKLEKVKVAQKTQVEKLIVEVPVEGDWLKELQSLTEEKEREV